MQARYYDPVIGRFYSNDPVDVMGHVARGNPIHGFNRYTYANNNLKEVTLHETYYNYSIGNQGVKVKGDNKVQEYLFYAK